MDRPVDADEIKLINELAWNRRVEEGNVWTRPVSPEAIASARRGEVCLSLGGDRPIPKSWLPNPKNGNRVLCLASGGGQQGPLFAALGWQATVLDQSAGQLAQDRMVAAREGLDLRTVQGDMCDLSMFADGWFDLVFCPVSVTYIPDVKPMFQEVHRVLKTGGTFLFGTTNPHIYIFGDEGYEEGHYQVKNVLPYRDGTGKSLTAMHDAAASGEAVEFSHTMEALIGSQLAVGFAMTGFFESNDQDPICRYFGKYFNMRSVKI